MSSIGELQVWILELIEAFDPDGHVVLCGIVGPCAGVVRGGKLSSLISALDPATCVSLLPCSTVPGVAGVLLIGQTVLHAAFGPVISDS